MDGVEAGQVTIYLFVYNDVHFDTSVGPALENSVEPVILIKLAWPPKIQLRGKPPVLGIGPYMAKHYRSEGTYHDENSFFGIVKYFGQCPKVIMSINVP